MVRRPLSRSSAGDGGPIGRATWLPLGFVVLSLLALLIVPILIERRNQAARAFVAGVYEPIRSETGDMLLAVAHEAGALRNYVATGEPVWLFRLEQADTQFATAARNIRSRASSSAPELLKELAAAETAYEFWRQPVDSLAQGQLSREEYAGRLVDDAARVEAALDATYRLELAVVDAQATTRAGVTRSARISAVFTAILAVLALVSSLLLLRVGARLARLVGFERAARDEAERRAKEERALSTAIAELAASQTIQQVIERLASYAVQATDASGAVVARVQPQAGELLVVAVDGARVPAVGLRLRYSGSYLERVLARERPESLERFDATVGSIPEPLVRSCPDCPALLIPLVDAGDAIGVLILIGAPADPPFPPDQVQRAHAFGNLAAIAIRKVRLLQDSENRREALVRSMESRARLMRGFSHDVKNPLGAADGYLQLLEDGLMDPLSPNQDGGVKRARRAIRSALDLIDELLELARAERAEIEVERVPTDVAEAARDIAEEYRAQAESKGLELELLLAQPLPVIPSDPTRLRQILGNLLSNAVKFTDHGRIVVSVRFQERSSPVGPGSWVMVQVSDTGPGIAADKHDLIFDEFTRGDAESRPGVGVGLAFSKRISHALGGDLTVESTPGRGSTFTLWLPVEPRHAERRSGSR